MVFAGLLGALGKTLDNTAARSTRQHTKNAKNMMTQPMSLRAACCATLAGVAACVGGAAAGMATTLVVVEATGSKATRSVTIARLCGACLLQGCPVDGL